jgi:uncharacterized protein YkwD
VRAGLAAVLLAAACGVQPPRRAEERPPILRLGPDRTAIVYDDPREADKRRLLARINRDRAAAGLPPVRYEPRASLVGDLFCLDAALGGFWGHWDHRGRPPFVRWGLSGGVDFHAQNSAAISSSDGVTERPVLDLMLESHQAMMDEKPPKDGHRRLILDPAYTHVGIGVAVAGGEFRLTQEFTRVAFEWIEVPATPLAAGATATFAGKPLPGWEVTAIEIRHEPPPKPLSARQLRRLGSYGYPKLVRTFDDFGTDAGGTVSVRFPLDEGAGYYFVLCFVAPRSRAEASVTPATAAMVTALP